MTGGACGLWINPAGRARAARQFTNALGALDRNGDLIWEHMCFTGAEGEEFTLLQIAEWLAGERGLALGTARQHVSAFFAYCKEALDDFHGPASRLQRVRRGVYKLADGPCAE
jgi:hypothetical protein